jgi:hypothetical protein
VSRSPADRSATCSHCDEHRKTHRTILEQPVCERCALRFIRSPGTCPGCNELKVLAFYDPLRRPVCATCAGAKAVYGCSRCGREDNRFGRMCAPCTLHDRASELLADASGRVHPQLQPAYDALVAGPRPQTTLYWFTRSTGPGILRSMARGEVEISHDTFISLPSNRTVNYVRDLLVAVGVLPAYHAELERVTPWLRDVLSSLPSSHADLLGRYAKWHLLRRLRHQEQAGAVTHGAIAAARSSIVASARLLTSLDDHDSDLATVTQAILEEYAVERPGQAIAVVQFLGWGRRNGVASAATLPTPQRGEPKVTLDHEARWAQIEQLLHDDTFRMYSRVAGLFTLLYAQPLARICRMRADQVTVDSGGSVCVTFDSIPVELHDPLKSLLLQHLAQRGQASYVSRADRWLFPGGIPGKHIATECVRGDLVARGIHPAAARNAAMFQLAGVMPSPVLADVLGVSYASATRWAALASHDWSQYAAERFPG